ncbi:ral guanine nucleotide dissociation stimulator-like 3 isoform X2 [Rhinatrema bivittatum]|uniref:ral guanine nucleotide dissociation stimulator-like 3 isoform X2 n=1 Tax=Rhinatrema bivittatum TaxID=194408 RepID=UPI00112C89D8|nr:ral guanine nucleotide dissociation stimulator-like 3 isoform X2 [Rhinatrema bivittatum]
MAQAAGPPCGCLWTPCAAAPWHRSPLQEWGEEVEEDAVYSITLCRSRTDTSGHDGSSCMDAVEPPPSPAPGFVQYRTCKLRTLKAGNLRRLVRNLGAVYGGHDQGYIQAFLATYRAFASPGAVLQLLLESCDSTEGVRGLGSSPLDGAGAHQARPGTKRDTAGAERLGPSEPATVRVQRALPYILRAWLESHPEDFRDPPRYCNLRTALAYLREISREAGEGQGAEQAESLLQRFREQEQQQEEEQEQDMCFPHRSSVLQSGEEEADGSLNRPDLLSFPAEDIAEQLTLMDALLFQKVVPFHCLGCIWSQRDKKENKHVAPTVRATVAQFNSVAGCVTASVLADVQMKAQQRAKVMEKWICVAQKCRLLRNFSSLRAILSALQSNPIYRLKRTWAAVNRDILSIFHKLCNIFSDENNHLSSREILVQEEEGQAASGEDWKRAHSLSSQDQPSKSFPATVPYLGTFLTDLVMLDTALPDYLENGLINFEKRRKEFETLHLIQRLQLSCRQYSLSPKPLAESSFRGHRQLTDDQSYRMSRAIEPPADSCPNSPRIRRRLTKRFSSLLLGSEWPRVNVDRRSVSPSGSCSSCDADEGPGSALPSPDGGLGLKGGQDFPPAGSAATGPPDDSSLTAAPAAASSLPIYNQQIADLCIIRVSVENDACTLYKSILLTSQDKAPAVILRALHKHNLEQSRAQDFQLVQVLDGSRELVIPDSANVYYAMCTAGNFDFLLRMKKGATPSSPLSPLPPRTPDGPPPQRPF